LVPAVTGATAAVLKPAIGGTVAHDSARQVGQVGLVGNLPPVPQVSRNWGRFY
jgi:hypothetical protein